jgi:hypothetical protein
MLFCFQKHETGMEHYKMQTTQDGRWIAAKCPRQLADLVDAAVSQSSLIGGRSSFVRYALALALADVVDRQIVTDPELVTEIHDYLERSSRAIGEPLSTR